MGLARGSDTKFLDSVTPVGGQYDGHWGTKERCKFLGFQV